MITQEILNQYEINSVTEYFNLVTDSIINGQHKQAKEQIAAMSSSQIDEFIQHCRFGVHDEQNNSPSPSETMIGIYEKAIEYAVAITDKEYDKQLDAEFKQFQETRQLLTVEQFEKLHPTVLETLAETNIQGVFGYKDSAAYVFILMDGNFYAPLEPSDELSYDLQDVERSVFNYGKNEGYI